MSPIRAASWTRPFQSLLRFARDPSGATSTEYAIVLALILVGCVAALTMLGFNGCSTFARVNAAL